MAVSRLLPGREMEELLELARDLAARELAPRVDAAERDEQFPRAVFATLGRAGLLGLPFQEEYGGGGVPYEVYLQVLEELAGSWFAVALGVSVHTLSCLPLAEFGTTEQRKEWLPELIGGELLGAYALSEPQAGSDAAALTTRAVPNREDYLVDGVKAWISHAGVADFYTTFVRTGPRRSEDISCLLIPADAAGIIPQRPERKMGLRASPTAQVVLQNVRVSSRRRIGPEGRGFAIALSALDSGRLGIAACATGLAQAALDYATEYAGRREQFGRPVIEFEGVSFMLADMATAIAAGRALYLFAARLRDAGRPYGKQAAMAKLFCTDAAMRVTTDAVQILGGAGYVEDHPVERWMREAKVAQIFEGTNQIQRIVIGRHLREG